MTLAEAAPELPSAATSAESYGELIQIDGSEHRWFENRADPCTLLIFIDDATGKLMQLRFVPSESTASYLEALQGYPNDHGCPIALLLRQTLCVPRHQAGGEGRPRHDPVRACAC